MKVKNLFNSSLLMLCIACGTANTEKAEMKVKESPVTHKFLLGTYTNSPEQGIHLMEFDPAAGEIKTLSSASDPDNPSFVIANKAQDRVYAVEETGGDEGGKVSAFSLIDGKLKILNTVKAEGKSPCYITLDPSEGFVVAAHYSSGDFSIIPISEDGQLETVAQVIVHKGSSLIPNRQKQPHVHSAIFNPKDGNLFIADLGTDEVVVYDFDSKKEEPLNPEPIFSLKVAPGAGPRHMVFNNAGDRLYLIHEISAEVGVYAYNDGELKHIATHKLTEDNFEGNVGAAEVRLSPDGKFLYASNRGDANEIIVFKIIDKGDLVHVQTISSGGKSPRNFNITLDGKYLLAANQGSNSIIVFERDLTTGEIKPTDIQTEIHKPVYINFLP
ncbi:lactonase family protein [Cyclobacterium qasimii]|uniref:6-phosphogluconolactonase n=2 Tax=Cyclobacterium qasimii TaxID=1350429 RepID=S7X700_9BACT|nr:lactonase family protein [Cyclobacterium qasimii]EPR71843.1 6-phosphogluconolactonase [Cyclobacterium qasimii M12-11B]